MFSPMPRFYHRTSRGRSRLCESNGFHPRTEGDAPEDVKVFTRWRKSSRNRILPASRGDRGRSTAGASTGGYFHGACRPWQDLFAGSLPGFANRQRVRLVESPREWVPTRSSATVRRSLLSILRDMPRFLKCAPVEPTLRILLSL